MNHTSQGNDQVPGSRVSECRYMPHTRMLLAQTLGLSAVVHAAHLWTAIHLLQLYICYLHSYQFHNYLKQNTKPNHV